MLMARENSNSEPLWVDFSIDASFAPDFWMLSNGPGYLTGDFG
jgi:hypothetical protein